MPSALVPTLAVGQCAGDTQPAGQSWAAGGGLRHRAEVHPTPSGRHQKDLMPRFTAVPRDLCTMGKYSQRRRSAGTVSCPGESRSLPVEARRDASRVTSRGAIAAKCRETRSVGLGQQPPTLRERRPYQRANCTTQPFSAREGPAGGAEYWRNPLRHLAATVKLYGRPVALDMFSGSGRFSNTWRQHSRTLQVPIFEMDIVWCADNNLCLRSVVKTIRGWLVPGQTARCGGDSYAVFLFLHRTQ